MPLIRYKLGDIGVLSPDTCSCGVNTPLLLKIVGRKSDFITTSSGRLIHGEYFTHIFYGRHGVSQFQFVQDSFTHYTVRLVRNGELSAAELEEIRREIVSALGTSATITFEFHDQIPALSSGKFRFTISKIPTPGGG
jgi:phenylacetate-CoA ligase